MISFLLISIWLCLGKSFVSLHKREYQGLDFNFGRALAHVTLRVGVQGRRAAGCAIASVLRPHPPTPWARVKEWARGFAPSLTACPPHASRR
ncbi:MAG: hypothetical protein RML38_04420 [Bacteroidia bacterium]|nr:hypothetical protein [Bacteroidia bacterium]